MEPSQNDRQLTAMTSLSTEEMMLSKSTYVRGCKCLKSLYLNRHQKELRDPLSASQQAVYDRGHEVGLLAQLLFPGGADCAVTPAYDADAALAKTAAAFKSGAKVLYEAAFLFNGVYAAVDILTIGEDGWKIYEVKSSKEVKDYQLVDVAIQWYILKGLGLPLKAINLVTINTSYVKQGAINPQEFFTITDVTRQALEQQPMIPQNVSVFTNTLKSNSVPEVALGAHCEQFYDCDFHGHCWKEIRAAAFPVDEISMIGKKKYDLIGKGIYCQTQVPDDVKLSARQRNQVKHAKTKTAATPNQEGITRFLEGIKWPVAFFDFETVFPAIPVFDGTSPFQQVPVQYSIHLAYEDGSIKHFEFLGEGQTDPRRELVAQMIDTLRPAGSILVYNKTFEEGVLKQLAIAFPDCAIDLNDIVSRLVDLIVPFRKNWVYDYRMNGSASLKSVLPALLPHLGYDDLEIGEGGTASRAYLKLMNETDPAVVAQTRKALLDYCKLDTWAMVELWRWLRGVSNKSN